MQRAEAGVDVQVFDGSQVAADVKEREGEDNGKEIATRRA